ncbi:MAG: cellulase family glycosylhydrolase [Lentisphaeraceae bacterium]|nr:cellulase family glycosylhydrolase [Lentisphaeraceae bacterium]
MTKIQKLLLLCALCVQTLWSQDYQSWVQDSTGSKVSYKALPSSKFISGSIPSNWQDSSAWSKARVNYSCKEDSKQAYLSVIAKEKGVQQLIHIDKRLVNKPSLVKISFQARGIGSDISGGISVGLREMGTPWKFGAQLNAKLKPSWQTFSKEVILYPSNHKYAPWILSNSPTHYDLKNLAIDIKPLSDNELKKLSSKPILDTKFQKSSSLKSTGWVESSWKKPQGYLTLNEKKLLNINVQAAAVAEFKPCFKVRKDKVYKIEFKGKAIGQIEGVKILMRRLRNPFTFHGGQQFKVVRDWQTFSTQIKPKFSDGETTLIFNFRGIGTYQIEWVRITEHDRFELPKVSATPQGNLIKNSSFNLRESGWAYSVPTWGNHQKNYFKGGSLSRISSKENGGYAFQAPKGIFGFLTTTYLVKLKYGSTYRLKVQGSAKKNDLALWIGRPREKIDIVKKLPINFKNGLAEASYTHQIPNHGTLSNRPSEFYLRVEHFGKDAAQIDNIQFIEETKEVLPSITEASIRVLGMNDALRSVAQLGEKLQFEASVINYSKELNATLTVKNANNKMVFKSDLIFTPNNQNKSIIKNDLPALPIGWYKASITFKNTLTKTISDTFAVIPQAQKKSHNKFLGVHIPSTDPRLVPFVGSLGIQTARSFEFSWNRIEQKKGTYNFPMKQLNSYLDNNVSPMVILNGSPKWISSKPEDREYSAYPPLGNEEWIAFVKKTVTLLKGKVHIYQIWNEPNGYFLKVNRKYKESLEDAYVRLAKSAYKVIREIDPTATIVVGATAGHAPNFFRNSFKRGLLKYCDVVSYHAYGESSFAGRGAPAFRTQVKQIQDMMKKHQLLKPLWDCESGYSIPDGPQGLQGSITLLQGLISRQAAGIDRHYLYTAKPRYFPNQSNFHMLIGMDNRPLVSVPIIAVYNTILGDAKYIANRGNDAKGVHLYEYHKENGQKVFIGWHTTQKEFLDVQTLKGQSLITLDAFGQIQKENQLTLSRKPLYFCTEKTVKLFMK